MLIEFVRIKTAITIATSALKIATAASVLRLSMRSTKVPIAIAKKSQGSKYMAPERAIKTVSLVSEIASSGAAAAMSPSPSLADENASQSRLKAGPRLVDFGTALLFDS
jgi:hypothetical protein